MSDDKKPTVVIPPELQAMMNADPELKKAMDEFCACATAAMEGVKNGTYPSFDIAMEFLTGHKPELMTHEDWACVQRGQRLFEDDDEPEAN